MSELTKLLISSLIKQRMEEPARLREEEARRAEIQDNRRYNEGQRELERKIASEEGLLQGIVEGGGDPSKMHGMFQSLSPGLVSSWAEFSKFNKKRKAEAEALDPQGLAALGAVGAPVADAGGRLVPPPQASQEAFQAGLQQRAGALQEDPEAITRLVQMVEQSRSAQESNVATGLSQERRVEAVGRRVVGAADFKNQRDLMESAEANYIAYVNSGAIQGDVSVAASAERLKRAGMPDGVATSGAMRAQQVALGLEPKILEARASTAGLSDRQRDVDTRKELLKNQFGDVFSQKDLNLYANAIESQQGYMDPYSTYLMNQDRGGAPNFIPANTPKETNRAVAKREGLVDQDQSFLLLNQEYNAAEAARADPNRRGEFTGGAMQTEKFFDFLGFFGAGPGEIINLRTASIRYAFAAAKATQGARASDIDFAKNMLYVPVPNEVGTELGRAKMRQLKQVLELDAQAPFSRDIQEKLKKAQNASGYREASAALNAVANKAAEEQEATGSVSNATQKRLGEEILKFQNSTGADAMKRALVEQGLIMEHEGPASEAAEAVGGKF